VYLSGNEINYTYKSNIEYHHWFVLFRAKKISNRCRTNKNIGIVTWKNDLLI